MNKKIILALLLIFVILFVVSCAEQAGPTEVPVKETQDEGPITGGVVKQFKITAKQFEFEPAEIRVKRTDLVKFEITSIDVAHGFAIDAFGINEKFEAGETVKGQFVADKRGEFPFYCSVFCGHGHGKMQGKLIVE